MRRVPPDQLERKARTDAPQGVVAYAAPVPSADVDDLLGDPGAFLVALDGVTDPQNLGAVMRTAETAGATGIVLARHRAVGITPAVTKAAAGAIEYLPVAFVSGIVGMLELGARGGRVVCGTRCRRRHVGVRPPGRRPAAGARPGRRGTRLVAARVEPVRGRRVDPDARQHRVAQRERRRRGRGPRFRGRCARGVTGKLSAGD